MPPQHADLEPSVPVTHEHDGSQRRGPEPGAPSRGLLRGGPGNGFGPADGAEGVTLAVYGGAERTLWRRMP